MSTMTKPYTGTHITSEVLVFTFVRDNSGMYNSEQILNMLLHKHGFKLSTIYTTIQKMISCGIFYVTPNGKIGTKQREYVSIYRANKKLMAEGKKNIKLSTNVQKTLNKKLPTNNEAAWTPEYVANNLNMAQAHALFSYMDKFFGGNK
jgi:hypothetical protein